MAENTNKNKGGSAPDDSTKEFNIANAGINMDSTENGVKKGLVSYALNAVIENFNSKSVNYQNELGNVDCLDFPKGFILIGKYYINEQYRHIFFLTNPNTGEGQIGEMLNNDCTYTPIVSSTCCCCSRPSLRAR